MGDLRNCPNCGKVFVKVNRNLCPACIQEEEEKFEEVRAYLKRNPGATVERLAEEFEIEESVILRWMREGRIQEAEVNLKLTCQRCGVSINIGNLCSKCAKALTSEMMDKAKKERAELQKKDEEDSKEKQTRRMFVLDRFKD